MDSHLPKILIQIGVSYLLQRLNIVHGDQMAVQIHELDAHLLEGSLGQQVTLDPREINFFSSKRKYDHDQD